MNQQREDLVVAEALSTDLDADLACSNPPSVEELSLTLQDVLVQEDHAGAGCSVYSSA